MITKLFRLAVCFLTIVTLGCLASCKDDETDVSGEPSIEVRNTEPDYTSIKFTIVPTNATSYAYACVPYDDYKTNNYTLTKVEGGQEKEYTAENLEYSSPYVIVAIAYNGLVASKEYLTRVTTKTEVPTVEISSIEVENDTAKFTVKTADDATSIMYAFYTQKEADYYVENPWDPTQMPDWRTWTEITEIVPDGTSFEISKLKNDDYVIEVYAVAKTEKSESATKTFKIKYYTIPIVQVTQVSLLHNSALFNFERNPLCSKYYVGMTLFESYSSAQVFSAINTHKDAILHTQDLKNADLIKLVEATFTDWASDTKVTLWVVPCDLNGNYLDSDGKEDPSKIQQIQLEIPKQTYVYEGVGTVAISNDKATNTSFTATATPSKCVQYYVLTGEKNKLEEDYPSQKILIETGLLSTPPLTDAQKEIAATQLLPGNDYIIYAIGIDADGKIGTLTKHDIKTPEIAYDSSAAITNIEAKPTDIEAAITFTKNEECQSMRFVNISYDDFLTKFNGSFKKIHTGLALNSIDPATGITIQTRKLTREKTIITFKDLNPNKRYLLFILPLDADGKFGVVKSLDEDSATYQTQKIDLTGTAVVTLNPYTESPSSSGVRLRFTATPNADTKAYYIHTIDKATADKLQQSTLITEIMKKGDLVNDPYGDNAPTHNFDKTINVTSYLYILCRDKNGKYNDPNSTKKLIEVR